MTGTDRRNEIVKIIQKSPSPVPARSLAASCQVSRQVIVQDIALIRLIRDRKHKADPNAPRRHGFLDYIEETFPQCRIHTLFIHPEQPDQAYATLERFFRENL